MIDPTNPPSLPTATQGQLEEFLMFAIAVAGKNAERTAVGVDRLISSLPSELAGASPASSPLARLARWLATECYRLPCDATGWDGGWSRGTQVKMLGELVRAAGLGCYNQRAASYLDLLDKVRDGLDIRTCTVDELEQVHGIGRKTSRFFVMYTRPESQEHAILDVHILRWLREQGYECVPAHTPRSQKKYRLLESSFVWEAGVRGMTPLELDTAIWQERRIQ